jgi:hydrogenase nickel incorporation protein HypA/HybF
MHETALAESVAEIVADEVAKAGASGVRSVVLSLGALSHVDPDALAFCFDVAVRGGPAEGAALVIRRPPGKAWCMGCGSHVDMERRGDPCPVCGSGQLLVTAGDDMRVEELEVV